MNENWSDFEKFVFKKFEDTSKEFSKLGERLSKLEGRAMVWGGLAGTLVLVIGEAAMKAFGH